MNKVGFVVVFQRILRFPDGNRKRFRADRPPSVVFDNGTEYLPVIIFQTEPVDMQPFQPLRDGYFADGIAAFDKRKIPHPPKQPVGHTRRSAGAAGKRNGRLFFNIDFKNIGGMHDNRRKLFVAVKFKTLHNTEPADKRTGHHSRAGSCTDQRKRRQRNTDSTRSRPLPDNPVKLVIFHSDIEHLFDSGF